MIHDFPGHAHVFLAIGATDMRKSINGLSLLVEDQFTLDLFSGSYFAFCNRRRDIVKILYWAENGFCIYADIRIMPRNADNEQYNRIIEGTSSA